MDISGVTWFLRVSLERCGIALSITGQISRGPMSPGQGSACLSKALGYRHARVAAVKAPGWMSRSSEKPMEHVDVELACDFQCLVPKPIIDKFYDALLWGRGSKVGVFFRFSFREVSYGGSDWTAHFRGADAPTEMVKSCSEAKV